MKTSAILCLAAVLLLSAFVSAGDQSDVALTCFRAHKATNTCHFNFTIDGARYRYVDIGCKYSKKHSDVIKKAKDGTLALAREWKIECSEKKEP
jgi:hypothetical protein